MAHYLPTYCERRLFLSETRPQKWITHNIWPPKVNWAPTRERDKKRQCQETKASRRRSMFICFSSQFGSSRDFKGRGGGGGVCDLECVQTQGLSPRPLLPRPAGYLAPERPVRSQPRLGDWDWLRGGETGRERPESHLRSTSLMKLSLLQLSAEVTVLVVHLIHI